MWMSMPVYWRPVIIAPTLSWCSTGFLTSEECTVFYEDAQSPEVLHWSLLLFVTIAAIGFWFSSFPKSLWRTKQSMKSLRSHWPNLGSCFCYSWCFHLFIFVLGGIWFWMDGCIFSIFSNRLSWYHDKPPCALPGFIFMKESHET